MRIRVGSNAHRLFACIGDDYVDVDVRRILGEGAPPERSNAGVGLLNACIAVYYILEYRGIFAGQSL